MFNDQNQEPLAHPPTTGRPPVAGPLAQSIGIVLLAPGLLFLSPTLQFLFRRPFIKTTAQLVEFHSSVEENLLFPASLIACFLGLMVFRRGTSMHRIFLGVFLSAFACAALLAPIFLGGAVALGVGILIQYSWAPTDRHRSHQLLGCFIPLFLILIPGTIFVVGFEPQMSAVIFPLLIMAGVLLFRRREGAIAAAGILSLLFFMLPFHMKASHRSMTARVNGDLRTMSIALETYYLENNTYPPHTFVPAEKADWRSTVAMPTFRLNPATGGPSLTTPVAYITTLFQDPFCYLGEERTFAYYANGFAYIVISPGPNCVFDLTSGTLDLFARQFNRQAPGNPLDTLIPFSYDPSNGSLSAGDFYRIKY